MTSRAWPAFGMVWQPVIFTPAGLDRAQILDLALATGPSTARGMNTRRWCPVRHRTTRGRPHKVKPGRAAARCRHTPREHRLAELDEGVPGPSADERVHLAAAAGAAPPLRVASIAHGSGSRHRIPNSSFNSALTRKLIHVIALS